MCERTPLHDLNLDHFGTRLDMVNEVLKGRVMMCAQKRSQLNKLKQALGQTQERFINNNSSNSSDNFTDNFNRDFNLPVDATRNSSSASNRDFDPTNDATYDSSFDLPDNYLCGGSPDKLMMEALKELFSQL